MYFTASGTVWHTRRECSHIKNSANVQEGTLLYAIEKGKIKQCSSCLNADEKDENNSSDDENSTAEDVTNPEQIPPTSGEDGDNTHNDDVVTVFWLSGGRVWHKSASCSYISSSSNVKSGSIEDAQNAGIANPCSRCTKSES